MSPILVRPVREQLEHDRIIRLLQAKNRRRYEVGINPGAEQNAAVGSGPSALYPDLVLVVARTRPPAASGRRGGDGRIGQSSRSARAVGALRATAGRVSSVRALPAWSTSRGGSAKTTRSTSPRSGAFTRSATKSASRWCTAAAKPPLRCARLRLAVRRSPRRDARRRRRPAEARGARAQSRTARRRSRRKRRSAKAASRLVAFLRFSRDKRGYEHIYLVQPSAQPRQVAGPRALLVSHAAGRQGRARAVRRASGARSRRRIPTSRSIGARFSRRPFHPPMPRNGASGGAPSAPRRR